MLAVLENPLAVFQKTVEKHAGLKLTLAEERDFIKAAQEGDKQAMETLLGKDIRFIIKIASECFEGFKGFKSFNLPFTLGDFIGWGAEGYLKALKHYDEKKGKRLLTYAGYWIRRLIYYYLKEENCLIRVPRKEQDKRRAAGVYVLPQVESLDAPISSEEEVSFWLDFLADPDEMKIFAFADFELWQKVLRQARLTEREKEILFQCIFMEKKQTDWAREIGLSREGIRQIKNKAEGKIRAACLSIVSEQKSLKRISVGEARAILKKTDVSDQTTLSELLALGQPSG